MTLPGVALLAAVLAALVTLALARGNRDVRAVVGPAALLLVFLGALVVPVGASVPVGGTALVPGSELRAWFALASGSGLVLCVVAVALEDSGNSIDSAGSIRSALAPRFIAPAILLVIASGAVAVSADASGPAILAATIAGIAAAALVEGGEESALVAEVTAVIAAAGAAAVAIGWLEASGVLGAARAVGADVAPPDPTAFGGGAVGLAILAATGAIAARIAAPPLHRRAIGAVNRAGPLGVPIILAWAPALLAVVLISSITPLDAGVANGLQVERGLVVAGALVTIGLATLAASVQDSVRHLLAYSILAQAAFLLLPFAAVGGDVGAGHAGTATRAWALALVPLAASLGAIVAALEAVFGTDRVADLNGWARRAPLLGAALAAGAVALAWPGLGPSALRDSLVRGAVDQTLVAVVAVLGVASVLPLLRLSVVGLRRPGGVVLGAPTGWLRPSRPSGRGPTDLRRRVAGIRAEGIRVEAVRAAALDNRILIGAAVSIVFAAATVVVLFDPTRLTTNAAEPPAIRPGATLPATEPSTSPGPGLQPVASPSQNPSVGP